MIARSALIAQVCTLLFVGVGAASASPQAPKQPSKWAKESQERTDQALRERDRELLHPGGALDVVGVEQEGNGFRSSTPALEHGALTAAKVDIDELYARRLAMYEDRRSFHTPVGPAREEVDGAELAPDDASLRAPEAATDPARSNTGLLLTMAVLAVLGSVWIAQRAPFKRALQREPAAH